MIFLYVGVGGGIGAVCRYMLSTVTVRTDFPLMTFITNLIGAILIGIIVGITDKKDMPEWFTPMLKTGFCGGFTTFSTFSLETMNLLQDGKYFMGTAYAVLSLMLCVAGVVLGKFIVSAIR